MSASGSPSSGSELQAFFGWTACLVAVVSNAMHETDADVLAELVFVL